MTKFAFAGGWKFQHDIGPRFEEKRSAGDGGKQGFHPFFRPENLAGVRFEGHDRDLASRRELPRTFQQGPMAKMNSVEVANHQRTHAILRPIDE